MRPKLLSLLLISLLCCQNSFAQDCHFAEDTKDKFTGEMHRASKKFALADHVKTNDGIKIPEINCTLVRDGNDFILKIGFIQSLGSKSGIIIMNYATGDKIILLLDNKETISIPVISAIAPKGKLIPNYSYDFKFSLSTAQMLKLNLVTDIRVVATVNSMDFEVEKGARTAMQQMIRCLMQ